MFSRSIVVTIMKRRSAKILLTVLLVFSVYTLFGINRRYEEVMRESVTEMVIDGARRTHMAVVTKFFKDRQDWTTSNLGTMLFKFDEAIDNTPQNKTFVVLVWKHWNWLKQRHVYNYGSSNDPLSNCSVQNCIFTGDDDELETADAVLVHLQHGLIPDVKKRNREQRWIFLNDESPKNTFSLAKKKLKLKDIENVFNWSMTFRSDADIPVPYGRTVALDDPVIKNVEWEDITTLIPNWKKKKRDVLVTILMSNCAVKFRMDFIKELQKHIPVDVYGSCSNNATYKNRCPGHFRADCEPISEYLFYLVLENSQCREYLTEKIWYHAYSKGAIPIIMGVSRSDCEALLPPNSYLYIPMPSIKNETKMKAIASDILYITQNNDYFHALHSWRNDFLAVNEHGYFRTKSYHWCRVCEALNYNDVSEKVYNERDLQWFLDPKLLCETNSYTSTLNENK